MARMMNLGPEKTYRAVLLTIYGHTAPDWWVRDGLQSYTDTQGNTHQYHSAEVYGPFSKPAQAAAAITRQKARVSGNGGFIHQYIVHQEIFMEATDAVWTRQ
jgi:hypothetical protein